MIQLKKILMFFVVIGMLTSFISSAVWAQEPQPIATVTISIGDVFVKRLLVDDWQAIEVGMFLFEGDKLLTKDNGKAEVTFLDGSIVFLGNDTEIEFIEDAESKTKKDSIFLFFGDIWNRVEKGVNYEVETIHALATVRGTYFKVQVADKMEVWVKEGKVEIENQYGKIVAGKNTKTEVVKDVAPKKSRVRKSKLPKDIDLTTNYYMDVSIASMLYQDQWYKVSGFVKKMGTNEIIKDDLSLSIKSTSDIFLSENKRESDSELFVDVTNGIFEFYVKSMTSKGSFTLSGSKISSLTKYMNFGESLTKKNVIFEYKDLEGSTRRVNALFKKK
tara:strand:- start:75 stop:1067 length:993 start_codon:yes stop_codon:yes gene_type:complete